ncbi:RING-type domain-containing protein [Citrus sinensis]|nr:RING-type domain-containing protein [Citrus sinensis]
MFQSFMDMMELIFNGITLVKFLEIGILNDVFNVSRYWKSRKYLQSNQWLQSWLRREIQAVMQEEDVEIVVHHILGVVDSFLKRNKQRCQMGTPETKEEDFKALVSDAARPFLMARTDRFVNEMQLFLASALNIEAYDAVYMQRLGWNTPRVTMESGEGETSGQTPVIPYLHIFDEDSDGTD